MSDDNRTLKHQVESQKETLRHKESQVLTEIEACLKKYRTDWEETLDSTVQEATKSMEGGCEKLAEIVSEEIHANGEFQNHLIQQKEFLEYQTQEFSKLHNSAIKVNCN